jgi:prepilin-type N-terminal cleavage/methylation domain-containing protein
VNPDRSRADEGGFTLIELTVVMLLMSLVMISFYGALNSLTSNAQRQEALVTDQEAVRFAMIDMARELRGANPLEPLTTSAAYGSEVEAAVLPARGTTAVYVRWQLTGTTLTRSILDAPGGTATSTKTVLANVKNASTGVTLLRYYNSAGTELVAASNTPGDFSNCTVRIHISVSAAVVTGPAPFTQDVDAEIRNRLPGGIGC